MNYEMFQTALAEEVQRLLGQTALVSIQHLTKNNGVALDAICIQQTEEKMAPLIYLDSFYRRCCQGVPLPHLAKLLFDQYQEVPKDTPPGMENFHDFSKAKEHLYCRIINYDLNNSQLKSIPCKRFLDLAVTYYYQLEDNILKDAMITVTNEHCRLWNTSGDELYQIAWENTLHRFPAFTQSMDDTLEEMMSEEEYQEFSEPPADSAPLLPMYILTNTKRFLGSICMMYPGVLAKTALLLRSNLYILPSSIHECILVPESRSFPREELDEMVQNINTTQVEPQEVLSNHVYFYDWKTDSIRM